MENKLLSMNTCISGGASDGLKYFSLLHELHAMKMQNKKEPVFTCDQFSMISAGVVMTVPLLCGFSPLQIANMMADLSGDKYMKMIPDNPVKFAKWSRGLRRTFNKDCQNAASKFTWENMRKAGIISKNTKPLIGMCKYKTLWKIAGDDLFNGLGDGDFSPPWKEIKNGDPEQLIKDIDIYYFSDDGVYAWDFEKNKIKKVSDKVEPLSKVYMAAWSNSWITGKTYRLHFDRILRERAFDQGILNNKANLIDGETHCISCIDFPKKIKSNSGLFGISDFTYMLKKSTVETRMLEYDKVTDKPFYLFTDAEVWKAYNFGLKWNEHPIYLT